MEDLNLFKENPEYLLIYLKASTNYSSLCAHNHMKIVTFLKSWDFRCTWNWTPYNDRYRQMRKHESACVQTFRLKYISRYLADQKIHLMWKNIKIWNHAKFTMKHFSSFDYLLQHENLDLMLIFLMKEKKNENSREIHP